MIGRKNTWKMCNFMEGEVNKSIYELQDYACNARFWMNEMEMYASLKNKVVLCAYQNAQVRPWRKKIQGCNKTNNYLQEIWWATLVKMSW